MAEESLQYLVSTVVSIHSLLRSTHTLRGAHKTAGAALIHESVVHHSTCILVKLQCVCGRYGRMRGDKLFQLYTKFVVHIINKLKRWKGEFLISTAS